LPIVTVRRAALGNVNSHDRMWTNAAVCVCEPPPSSYGLFRRSACQRAAWIRSGIHSHSDIHVTIMSGMRLR